ADGPEPGEQNHRWNGKREQVERRRQRASENGVADRGGPNDSVGMSLAEQTGGDSGVEHGTLLLCLHEQLFGDSDLRRAAVGTEEKSALVLLGERGVTARAFGWGHSLRLREVCACRNGRRSIRCRIGHDG